MTTEEMTEHLIGIVKHQDWLNEQLLKIRMEEREIITLLKQNQKNWSYLAKELRKLVEEHDGLYSYVTSNLSKTVEELRLDKKLMELRSSKKGTKNVL